MARLADIAATARATVGHIIRYLTPGGGAVEMPNRQYLDFAGNCTVNDDGDGIRVTVPDVPAGSVQVGQVETLPSGTMAYVTNSGTNIHAILNFGIPRGDPSTDIQSIAFGGTGASTEEGARVNLGVPSVADLQAVSAVADNSVQLSGEQTVAGVKTFSSSPVVPTVTAGDNSTKAASTAYVDAVDATVVHLAGSETITGDKAFTGTVTAVTQQLSDDSTKLANTEWVRDYIAQLLSEMYFYERGSTDTDTDTTSGV